MLTNTFIVAKRYARALFSLAREHGIVLRTYEDMKYMHQVFSLGKDLGALMRSPVIREGKKQGVLRSLFEKQFHPLNMGYVQIVVRKQRAALLPGIAKAYLAVHKEAMGIETVRVTTAAAMDEALRKKAMEVASSLSNKTIEFQERIDPSIIGGFILNLGDKQYDASIKSRLIGMRKQLNV